MVFKPVFKPWMYFVLAVIYAFYAGLSRYYMPGMIIGIIGVIANLWMMWGAKKFYARR